MDTYILALDQGTTSSRALVFDRSGTIVSMAQKEFKQIYPQPGWVEHDPDEIWSSQMACVTEALTRKGIRLEQIAGIGITNQRETTVVWNRKTGRPIYNAIVWQDRRTAAFCDVLRASGKDKILRERTGLVTDAYFSGTKVHWILKHVPAAADCASDLAFGTIDSWLLWKLTGGAVHATDASNASRTLLFNIHTGAWDEDLLRIMDVPSSMLPEVKNSSGLFGTTDPALFGRTVPITGIAGDQQAALFGQLCTLPGMTKNTYGTGCFLMMNTGSQCKMSSNNLLSTVAWQLDGKITYALEGSVFIGGAVIQWLRDGLGLIKQAADSEALAASVPSSEGVYLVPAFTGLGAPHWDAYARGLLIGMTRGTGKAHIVRAALESIAYQSAEVVAAMEADAGMQLAELRVDGGASANGLLMQFQADLTGSTVIRPKNRETTAAGAAFLAGLGCGYWKDVQELAGLWQKDAVFQPDMTSDDRYRCLNGWQRAVERARGWAEN